MPKNGPCLRPAGHICRHTPDLTGMRFGNLQVTALGKLTRAGKPSWNCVDDKGRQSFNIKAQSLIEGVNRGINAPAGTGHIASNGYRTIRVAGTSKLEHRVIMEQALGRSLERWEQVHHGPQGKAVNTLNNLSLSLAGQHTGQSEKELAEWLRSVGWTIIPPVRLERK